MKSSEHIEKLIALLSHTSIKDYNRILKNFDFSVVNFKSFESWSYHNYTRNCLHKDAHFELILICWEHGQETKIHDHNGEDCWVYLLEGLMEEVYYTFNKKHQLQEIGARNILPQQLTFMNDTIGYHKLRNSHPGKSISLHLYAKPIDNCKYFNEISQRFEEKTLTYDTFMSLTVRH